MLISGVLGHSAFKALPVASQNPRNTQKLRRSRKQHIFEQFSGRLRGRICQNRLILPDRAANTSGFSGKNALIAPLPLSEMPENQGKILSHNAKTGGKCTKLVILHEKSLFLSVFSDD
ncbi:hypothetical protein [Succinimonas sp.]|uniref:hypothetical protein n=1 Tax=Succinimonas sp. TaxID=1936151 RepID=UPI00386D3392